MKIALLSWSDGVVGGYDVWLKQFTEYFIQQGHQIHFYDTRFIVKDHMLHEQPMFSYIKGEELLTNWIESNNPDVILVADLIRSIPQSILDHYKGRIVTFLHDIGGFCPHKGLIRKDIDDQCSRVTCERNSFESSACYGCHVEDANMYTTSYPVFPIWDKAITRRIAEFQYVGPSNFIAEFIYPTPCKVIEHGIDFEPEYLRSAGSKKVLIVYSWEEKLTENSLLDEVVELGKANGFEFYATGDISDQITEIPRFHDRSLIKDLYKGFDVYLAISQMKESYGLALEEARRCGLATVCMINTGATLERDPSYIAAPNAESIVKHLKLASEYDTTESYALGYKPMSEAMKELELHLREVIDNFDLST
jgi:glycosyltransferase involved in cell wall biosynthesis